MSTSQPTDSAGRSIGIAIGDVTQTVGIVFGVLWLQGYGALQAAGYAALLTLAILVVRYALAFALISFGLGLNFLLRSVR